MLMIAIDLIVQQLANVRLYLSKENCVCMLREILKHVDNRQFTLTINKYPKEFNITHVGGINHKEPRNQRPMQQITVTDFTQLELN